MTFFGKIRRWLALPNKSCQHIAAESARAEKTEKAIQRYDQLLQSTATNARLQVREPQVRESQARIRAQS
jgi:hypothetical protein